ncbi:MAG TPA: NUDIX hydrolase, partial [Aeromicrobium sp.]|nr:NUDIX hydrolase [Aeromicrobium sp.]
WDDACLFVFDLGVVDAELIEAMTLQTTEIRAVHWCDAAMVRERATAATIELLDAVASGPVPPYREAPHHQE